MFFLACLSSPEPTQSPRSTRPNILIKTVENAKEDSDSEENTPVGSAIISLFFINSKLELEEVQIRGPKHEKEQFALDVLYSGPKEADKKRGLYLDRCGSTGAKIVSIAEGLATIQLQGKCTPCGAIGIYDSIVKTAKSSQAISAVHLLDPNGKTQKTSLSEDARPACLEP